ncbi:cupin-like domain-containing protein [Marinimicrobium sp. ABcell2]|uniref:cupin-like domain-containing protein n=1 Tax=Marinimicrobium sp. ABcell2 TaxID=3069751 RepID=UPI0027B6C59E|nr:cupin-like domain-containing protein [Marinimicrobium sp. ABcell2]MDQ2075959.1 cupin-like domain-containing protein [Marinimicrobium sp. ABcell2]
MSYPGLTTLDNQSPDKIADEVLASSSPVYLPGFCADWPVVSAALKGLQDALDHLAQGYSGEPIRTCYLDASENGRVFYNPDVTGFNYQERRSNFLDVAKQLMDPDFRARSTVYISSTEVARCFPALSRECKIEHQASRGLVNIWIGGRSRVAAHYDAVQNLACCLAGRRKFTLFPPEQVTNLYPGPLNFAPGGREVSMVDFKAPDLEKYPRFAQAQAAAIEVELMPGDALVIPSMWWHHVEGLDDVNVLLTHWWKESPAYLGSPASALMHALLAVRDLPAPHRAAWRALFDYYVFDGTADKFEHIPEPARRYLTVPLTEQLARQLRAELQNQLRR